jgi:G protein-coupled receptor 158
LTCFLEPWFREIGFAFCYGAIVIKVYRIFAEFQTRKAHRVCVRDKDLLKYLGGIILVVLGYMSAWTALVLDGIDNISSISWFDGVLNVNITGRNILEEKSTQFGLRYIVCRQLSWDYVTEIGNNSDKKLNKMNEMNEKKKKELSYYELQFLLLYFR